MNPFSLELKPPSTTPEPFLTLGRLASVLLAHLGTLFGELDLICRKRNAVVGGWGMKRSGQPAVGTMSMKDDKVGMEVGNGTGWGWLCA